MGMGKSEEAMMDENVCVFNKMNGYDIVIGKNELFLSKSQMSSLISQVNMKSANSIKELTDLVYSIVEDAINDVGYTVRSTWSKTDVQRALERALLIEKEGGKL